MKAGKYILTALLLALEAGASGRPGQALAAETAEQRDTQAVVAEVRRLIAEKYVVPERRPALDAVLAEGLKSGRYDVPEPGLLAERINADLGRVGRDWHLTFTYDPGQFAAITARTSAHRPDPSAVERQVRMRNHGVRELRVLAGNVRYLELGGFEWIGEESEAALDTAMQFLSGGDAVVIDLRRNGGGHPRAVHHIISHFLEPDRPLVTFYEGGKASATAATLRNLKVPRMTGVPLYVLTSGGTGSAAEEFAGHVAGYRLGQVVGASTSGGAYTNQLFPVKGGFVLSVSTGRPVLASTGKDWEGVGIAPTIAAPAEAALDVAHAHALRHLAAGADTSRREELEALASTIEAMSRPGTPTMPLDAYAGTYGERRIFVEGGQLWYRQAARLKRPLVSLGGHRFAFSDDPSTHLVFRPAGARMEAFDLGPAIGPAHGRYELTP